MAEESAAELMSFDGQVIVKFKVYPTFCINDTCQVSLYSSDSNKDYVVLVEDSYHGDKINKTSDIIGESIEKFVISSLLLMCQRHQQNAELTT